MGQLFPNVEKLRISKTFNESNEITQDFDFSDLAKFKKLRSLALPITEINDYQFLNNVENISELTLSEYDPGSSLNRLNCLISQIQDDKSEQITKLKTDFYLDQNSFNRLCNQFSAMKELELYTDASVGNFDALSQMPNLEKLSTNNLVLTKNCNLPKLSSLRLKNPSSDTLGEFAQTSKSVPNLTDLKVQSFYENECKNGSNDVLWHGIFAGNANLPKLSNILLTRHTTSFSTPSGYGNTHVSQSGDAGIVRITQDDINSLAKTNVKTIHFQGFQPTESLRNKGVKGINISDPILKLVQNERQRPNTTFNTSEEEIQKQLVIGPNSTNGRN